MRTSCVVHTLCEIGEIIGRCVVEQKRQKREGEKRFHVDPLILLVIR